MPSRGERNVEDVANSIDQSVANTPIVEYGAGHFPGAIPIPPDQLDELPPHLPTDREIYAYCRGPYCVYADQGVRALNATGRTARRLEDGLPERHRAGGPVDTS